MKRVKILIITGISLIITGLVIQCFIFAVENKRQANDLANLKEKYNDCIKQKQ